MDLKDIASVSGKSGLFRVLKPTRTGVILETIDDQKAKLIANANTRVSLLKEISIYTTSKEGSAPLESVFDYIFQKFGTSINVNSKSTNDELTRFIESVLPEYDREKVYVSDIKKLATWYQALSQHFPERFNVASKSSAEEVKEEEIEKSEVSISEAKPAKKEKTAKKASKKTEQ